MARLARGLMVGLLLPMGCGGRTPPVEEGEEGPPPELAVALRLVPATDETADPPETGVRLVIIREEGSREVTDVGIYRGACSHAPVGGNMLVRVICWWGGTSAVVTLAREGDRLVVRRALGPDDVTVVEEVEVPRRALVTTIAPDTLPVE